MVRLMKTTWIAVMLFVLSAVACFAEDPVWAPDTLVTQGKNSIITLLTAVGPVTFGALAVVIGWRFAIKLFKRLGKSI